MSRVITCITLLTALLVPAVAAGHGSLSSPISRSLNCYLPPENPERPTGAACKAAVARGGTQAMYDWHEVSQLEAGGRHRQIIPDGRLCGAGKDKYAGLDLARTDWPATPMTPGAQFNFVFRAEVPHAGGHFEFYLTKPSYDPRQPLRWSDIEEFHRAPTPPVEGGNYNFRATLPADREGRHVVYVIWQRSGSDEAFYVCADVMFGEQQPWPGSDLEPPTTPTALRALGSTETSLDLDWATSTDNVGVTAYDVLRNGVVVASGTANTATITGLAPDTSYTFAVRARDAAGNQSASSAPVTARTKPAEVVVTPTPTATATEPPSDCSGFATTSDWGSGWVGEVIVRNPGTARVDDWRYTFSLPASATISSHWSARLTRTGTLVSFAPESWTASIAPGGSARFGFQVTGSGKPADCTTRLGS